MTTASLDFMTLVEYVGYLRVRPKVSGVWRGTPDVLGRSLRHAPVQTLSANSVNAYVRPLRSLAILSKAQTRASGQRAGCRTWRSPSRLTTLLSWSSRRSSSSGWRTPSPARYCQNVHPFVCG